MCGCKRVIQVLSPSESKTCFLSCSIENSTLSKKKTKACFFLAFQLDGDVFPESADPATFITVMNFVVGDLTTSI